MKRFLSLLIAVLMVVGMLPVVSMAETEYEHILLGSDNINIGAYANEGNGLTTTVWLENPIFGKKHIKINEGKASTADIYIEKEGDYTIWMFAADSAGGTRIPMAGFGSDVVEFSITAGLEWQKAENNGSIKTWHLAKGWHTITLKEKTAWNPFFFHALYITDDLTYVPDKDTDNDLLVYNDVTAPAFADDAEITYSFAEGACSLTFPEATDDNAIIYEYTIDGNTVEISNITQPVNVGSVTSETDVVLTASDKWGNSAEISATIVPDVTEPEDEYENILLGVGNFTLPTDGTITLENAHSGRTNQLIAGQDLKVNWNATSNPATAKVYVEEEGTYYMWILDSSNADNAADRYPAAGFDDDLVDFKLTSKAAFQWVTPESKSWTLTKGWHELKIKKANGGTTCFVNAVYITNDSSYEPKVDTHSQLLQYHDTTAPVFAASTDVTTSFENGSCSITFPAATDSNKVFYEYTLNGATAEIEDITQPVSVNVPAGESTITLAAYDKWGNKAEKTFTVTAPRNKWMLTWNNFYKPDYTSWTYQSSTSLVDIGKSIQPNTLNGVAGSTTAKAKALFYVEEAGNYAVWVLSKNGKTSDGRTAKIYVDGVADTTAYNDSTSFVWGKGTGPENGNGSWSLEKGWHTVEFGLSAAWKPYDMHAIYITSDLTETVTTDNDDALLAAYGDNSLCVDGDYYLTNGLEKGGYVIDSADVNITPILGVSTSDSTHTVTVNGSSAAWNTANAVTLNKGINTVAVDSTDDAVDCTFPVVSTAKVINYNDSAATITGGVESTFVGADGVTKAVYLDSADDSAKFSAEGIEGNVQVWVYVIGASTDSSATTSTEKTADDALISIKDSNTTTPKQIDNTRTTSSWINYGTYSFSGSADEYVEIKGNATEHVYVDSVKFVYVDEYLFSEPVISTDGQFSVTYDCYKQTDDDTTIAAIAAKYTGDVMNGASVNRLTHTDKGIYKITTNAFDITDGASYKAFIWDSTDNATPLASAVVYPEAE